MFGLFGPPVQKRATEGAIEATQTIVGLLQGQRSGIPQDFWRDPYVLGFFSIIMSIAAKYSTEGKAKGEILVDAQVEAFQTLSNLNGVGIVRQVSEMAQRGDPEFNRGADEGMATFLHSIGKLRDPESNPLVVECAARARNNGEVGAQMMFATIFRRAEELAAEAMAPR